MPIQLDKILADIAVEKVLHPSYPNASKKDMDDAWTRVGKNNKLSVHEARSIFKVLQKKYDQEKQKGSSAWKLYAIMDEIHRKVEVESTEKQTDNAGDVPMEEDEEYEMLEVQEEEEHAALAQASGHSTGSTSDGESPTKSMKSNSSTGSPVKDEKPLKNFTYATKTVGKTTISPAEEKKVLNTMASASPRPPPTSAAQTPAAAVVNLQKKGVRVKKNVANTPNGSNASAAMTHSAPTQHKTMTARPTANPPESKTLHLPESIKRKLSQEQPTTPQTKKLNIGQIAAGSQPTTAQTATATSAAKTKTSPQNSHTTTAQLMQVKKEREEQSALATHGINLITIPANPTRADLANNIMASAAVGPSSSTAATVASTSTNGYSPRIEDIDFRNDIIFDAGNGINGTIQHKMNNTNNAAEIINLGNFDNSLPPTFFKNLCNSSRHEALGLYVANVMNRLQTRSAAKLELAILRAIIDVQSDELEQ